MKVAVDVSFVCECGKKCIVGNLKKGKPVLIHELPHCRDFEKLPPDQYIAKNRRRLAGGIN